ncbi:patatin-like phospholipase family protein [Lewinella sp. JB7]|uniref:patatin-like phospholipase family protein n=1 Tax=Lewinella sp. JB7 TaxID=2962887 RepID=UPI0020C96B0E|nr:patatin-like phospholipase family protein [Lewinella sp. JB7]MCP9234332.1 patatin-like phospholipase family protein [Lewinella sp. JB7]
MPTKLTLLFLVLLCSCVRAQPNDLKVGLVLSGGGAKGYAHIGALRVIEESGVRVDYIGGTSMGAIVGGLYAAGYSADQLEELLRGIDIMGELQDAVAREDRTIYEKLYNEKYLLSISMQDFGIQLPTALSDGQRVHDLFAHWTADVGHIRDFDQLPIPYLAVATDLETGDGVVIETGMLAEAMRASAALPGVLSPYELNGRLLTDGGVSNNYPAEEIKAKGMDYVLGISVEADPLKAGEIKSVGDLIMQIAFFQANRRNLEQYEVTDLDIKPQLDGFSVLSFSDIDTLINAGYRAALEMKPQLDSLAARQRATTTTRDTSAAPVPTYFNVNKSTISGAEELSDRQILSYFEDKLPGLITWEDFRKGLTALHVTGRYANINYRWKLTEGAADGVDLDLIFEERPSFGQQLRLGLHYDQEYRANLLVNLTMYDLFIDNTIASLDVIAGNRLRYRFDYRIDRINGTAFGLRSRLDYADVGFDVQETQNEGLGIVFDRLDFRFSDLNAEAYWDLRQTQNSFTGIASGLKYYSTTSDQLASADTSGLFSLSNDIFSVSKLYFLYDKLNRPHFPLRGFRIIAEARAIRELSGNDNGWALNGDVDFMGLLPLGEKQALGLEFTAGGFLDASSLPYRYYLGSNNRQLMNNFKPFPSIDLGEASGSNLLLAELFLRRRLFTNHYLHLGARAARIGNPEAFPSSIDGAFIGAGVLGYGIDSPLGPIELTYGYGTEGGQLYFNLGHWF